MFFYQLTDLCLTEQGGTSPATSEPVLGFTGFPECPIQAPFWLHNGDIEADRRVSRSRMCMARARVLERGLGVSKRLSAVVLGQRRILRLSNLRKRETAASSPGWFLPTADDSTSGQCLEWSSPPSSRVMQCRRHLCGSHALSARLRTATRS